MAGTTNNRSRSDSALMFLNQDELTPTRLLTGLEQHIKSLYFRRVSLTNEFCHNLELFLQSSAWQTVELDAVTGSLDHALNILIGAAKSPIRHVNFCSMNHRSRLDVASWQALSKGLRRRNNNNNNNNNTTTSTASPCAGAGAGGGITSLGFSWTEITSEGMEYLAEGLKEADELEVLEFSCTFWTDSHKLQQEDRTAALHLSRGLAENQSLKDLILNGSNLSDKSAAVIVRSLVRHPTLQRLWLSMNKCGQETSTALAELLREPNCPLQELYLDGQRFPRGGRQQHCHHHQEEITKLNIAVIAQALRHNKSLQVLDLTDNHFIQDKELELLGQAMSISLDSNEPKNVNVTLQKLLLARNGITNAGLANFLYHILPGIRGLKTISLGGNVMEDISNKKANNCLLQNGAIKAMVELEDVELLKAVAAPEHLPPGLWPHMLYRLEEKTKARNNNRRKTNDLLYLFLRGPILMSCHR